MIWKFIYQCHYSCINNEPKRWALHCLARVICEIDSSRAQKVPKNSLIFMSELKKIKNIL